MINKICLSILVTFISIFTFNTAKASSEFDLPLYDMASGMDYYISDGQATVVGTNFDTSRTSITIPATLGGYPVTRIGGNAFRDFTHLKSISIPSSVTSIGESAFKKCSGITSIKLPSGLTTIEREAFMG